MKVNSIQSAALAAFMGAILGLAILPTGCSEPGPAPSVAIVEVTPTALDPASNANDDLSIVVDYFDSDGDLGGGLVEVHDCRADGLITALPIPPIASDIAIEQGVPIEGQLEIAVNDVGDVPPADSAPQLCRDLGVGELNAGQTVFCVVLIDAAGNAGTGACTEPIAIASP